MSRVDVSSEVKWLPATMSLCIIYTKFLPLVLTKSPTKHQVSGLEHYFRHGACNSCAKIAPARPSTANALCVWVCAPLWGPCFSRCVLPVRRACININRVREEQQFCAKV